MFCKSTDNVKVGNIIFYKIRVNPNIDDTNTDGFRLLCLQIVDQIAKVNASEVVYNRYIVAPYTLDIQSELPELQDYIDEYLSEDW